MLLFFAGSILVRNEVHNDVLALVQQGDPEIQLHHQQIGDIKLLLDVVQGATLVSLILLSHKDTRLLDDDGLCCSDVECNLVIHDFVVVECCVFEAFELDQRIWHKEVLIGRRLLEKGPKFQLSENGNPIKSPGSLIWISLIRTLPDLHLLVEKPNAVVVSVL